MKSITKKNINKIMDPLLFKDIENSIGKIKSVTPLYGGDISETFKIETSNQRFAVKVGSGENAAEMFSAEEKGLKSIAHPGVIGIPKSYGAGRVSNFAYLILEFIESKSPEDSDYERLGDSLKQLHYTRGNDYGMDFHNWIGSLEQDNTPDTNWEDFFIDRRIWSQLLLSDQTINTKFTTDFNKVRLKEQFKSLHAANTPSLLHGDLWSGNFLIRQDGQPFLIDPATYYGDPLVDIAMTKLFGGFEQQFYNTYFDDGQSINEALIEIYQLYYLLVHLNIFGMSYLSPVQHIMTKYFGS